MTAANHHLTCEQGATFQTTLTYKDSSDQAIDLTGADIRMQVRPAPGADIIAELTLANGRVTVPTPSSGVMNLTITAVDTAALTPGIYRYDLEVAFASGLVVRLLEGSFTILAEVTA